MPDLSEPGSPPVPALDPLIRAHADLVYATCRRILGNDADAADATQECFLRWLAERDRPVRNPAVWLHVLARTSALDWRRRAIARARAEHGAGELIMATNGTSDPSAWSEVLPHLDDALLELPEGERTLLVEHHLLGQEQAALAQRHRIDQGTVSRRLQRAREGLKRILERRGVVGAAVVLGLGAWSPAQAACPDGLAGSLATLDPADVAVPMAGSTWPTAVGVGVLGLAAMGLVGALLVGSGGGTEPAPIAQTPSATVPASGAPPVVKAPVATQLQRHIDGLIKRWRPTAADPAAAIAPPIGHVRRPSVEAWLARNRPVDPAAQDRFLESLAAMDLKELWQTYQDQPGMVPNHVPSIQGPVEWDLSYEMPAIPGQAAPRFTNDSDWIASPAGGGWLDRCLPKARAVLASFAEAGAGAGDTDWSAIAAAYAQGAWDPPLLDRTWPWRGTRSLDPHPIDLHPVVPSLRVLRLQAGQTGDWAEALAAADLVPRWRSRSEAKESSYVIPKLWSERDETYLAATADGWHDRDRLESWIREPSPKIPWAQEQVVGWLLLDLIPLLEDAIGQVPLAGSLTAATAAKCPGVITPGWWTPEVERWAEERLGYWSDFVTTLPSRQVPAAGKIERRNPRPLEWATEGHIRGMLRLWLDEDRSITCRAAARVILQARNDGRVPTDLATIGVGDPWHSIIDGDALFAGIRLLAEPPHGFRIVTLIPGGAMALEEDPIQGTSPRENIPPLDPAVWNRYGPITAERVGGPGQMVIRLDTGHAPIFPPADPSAPSGTN